MEDATNTLCSLRGLSANQVQEELNTLIAIEKNNQIVRQSLSERLSKLLDRTVLKPMALLIFLFCTQSFSGSNMISYYIVTILQVIILISVSITYTHTEDVQDPAGCKSGSYYCCWHVCCWLWPIIYLSKNNTKKNIVVILPVLDDDG